MNDLETLIRQYVRLGRRSSTGFESCKCQVCNDYQERGAFNFSSEGLGYNCFNCGAHFGIRFGNASKEAKAVLASFGLPIDEVNIILAKERLANHGTALPQAAAHVTSKHLATAPSIELPPKSSLVTTQGPWQQVAAEYMLSRGFVVTAFEAYISEDPKYEGRLILPVYDATGRRLVYWQARSMDDATISPRFKNPSSGKDLVIYNEQVLQTDAATIFVTEGIFDALSCGPTGIALLGSSLNEAVLFRLRRAALRGKKLVFLIDKNSRGADLAKIALAEGWSIVLMPDNISDANKCRTELGSLFLSSWLANNQLTGLQAKLTVKMRCK